jgi:hypothetical protein
MLPTKMTGVSREFFKLLKESVSYDKRTSDRHRISSPTDTFFDFARHTYGFSNLIDRASLCLLLLDTSRQATRDNLRSTMDLILPGMCCA